MANTRILNAAVVAALFAACTDVPCETKGAVRDHRDVCGCPDGTREIELVVNDDSKSECVSGDAGGVTIDNASEADASRARPAAADGGREMDAAILVDAANAKEAGEETEAAVLTAADAGDVLTLADAGSPEPPLVPAVPACIPAAEECDGKDNDCDEKVDEEVSEAPIGMSCTNGGQGACALPGKQACLMGKIVCDAPPPMPSAEMCDGIDNDCKNGVDDGLTNACGGSQCGAKLDKIGMKCTAGQGDCQGEGLWECDAAAGNNALRCTAVEKPKNACGATCGPVPAEDCSTPGDDNCNGAPNEGCCVPTAEVCGDSKDNDCDGQTDEGFTKNTCGGCTTLSGTTGQLCLSPRATCAVTGRYACSGTDTIACESTATCAPIVGLPGKRVQGAGFTCTLYGDGFIQCWGKNDFGQLGNGTRIDSNLPVDVINLPGKALSLTKGASESSVCAEIQGDTSFCWGLGFSPLHPASWTAIPVRGGIPMGGPVELN